MNILIIAGSDPSAGAGIQSDIKTCTTFGCYGLTAITAITSQNTSKFSTVEAISPKMVAKQIQSILDDFTIKCIKLGMLYNSDIIKTVHKKIAKLHTPIVVDPVIKSTSGGRLLEIKAIKDFKKFIIPLATIMTPNISELEVLSGKKITTVQNIILAAKTLQKMGAKNIVVTGFQKDGKIYDHIFIGTEQSIMWSNKINIKNHGSGCNYSAVLAASLAKNNSIIQSINSARQFAINSIKNSKKIGKGINITQPDKHITELKNAIDKFISQNITKLIPECQTNFVFSKPKPRSINDIYGVNGRIVKSKNGAVLSGEIILGGSKHVATAVLEMNKKFPEIRAGINIKYNNETITKLKEKLDVSSYDRSKEPKHIKSSIAWGIQKCTKKCDAIYHTGYWGKEPMIILFGSDPEDILKKIHILI